MRRGPKLKGVDDLIVERVRSLQAIVDGDWALPIAFMQEDGRLVGTLTLQVGVDLGETGFLAAERLVRLAFKQAILQAAGWAG